MKTHIIACGVIKTTPNNHPSHVVCYTSAQVCDTSAVDLENLHWNNMKSVCPRTRLFTLLTSWLNSLATWRPTTYSQIINPAFVDITPPRQRSSESSLTSTLPSIGTKSPFLPSLTSVQRSTLGITASYSNVFPRRTGSLGWLSPGWSPTLQDVCRSSMLVDASLPLPRFILVSLRVQS